MRKSIPAIIGLALILLFAGWHSTSAQGDLHFQDDFEGGGSQLWELESGWSIQEEGGSSVLKGEGHSWARLNLDIPGNFQLSFRLKIGQGRLHLITHLNDIGRYYIGIGSESSGLNKQYWPDNFQEGLANGGSPPAANSWMDVVYSYQESTLRLQIDGQQVWQYSDPEPLDDGLMAFETLEDSLVLIDDLQIFVEGAEPVQQAQAEAGSEPPAGEISWIRTGGPLGGLGYDVRMHPDNPDMLYVTDAYAGVFISEDGGKSWYPSNQGFTDRTGDSMDAIPVFCLTISPHNPDVIWAGMQYSGGLYRSVDGGRSWVRKTSGITLQDGLTFRGITFDPLNPDVVYAGGEISSWAWAGDPINGREFDLTRGVLYKSGDGGESWREIWRGDNLVRYVWVNPHNTDILYLSTGIFDREAANSDPVAGKPGGVGVMKSTDGGETWAPANNGLDNLYVGSLYMHPENPEILLAGTGNNQYWQEGGIYLTTDGALTWEHVYGAEYMNINSVEFSETNPEIAYAGESALILSSQDGGKTWEKVAGGLEGWGTLGVRGGFPIDFQVDPRDPERIFANNYGGGNFLSEDGGRTWQVASSGYTGAQVRGIALDPDRPGLVYVAARSGIFVSPNGGSSWIGLAQKPFKLLEWYAVAVDPSQPDHLLAASNWDPVILRSFNAGQTWEKVPGSPVNNTYIRVFTFAPSEPNYVYAGSADFISAGTFSPEVPANGIFLSRDGGNTWQQSTTNEFSDAHVMDLAINLQDHRIVYAATSNHGMLRTLDGGGSWQQVNQGLVMNQGTNAVALHPRDTGVVYAGVAFGGVYRSRDGGDSWQQISAGLNPEANISDLIIDPANPDIIYTSDLFSGVYRSLDGGDTWTKFSDGLRMRAVNKLALTGDGQHLYAATEGEGVYRIDLNGQPPEAVELALDSLDEQTPGADQTGEEQEIESTEPDEEIASEPDREESPDQPGGNLNRKVCPTSYLPLVVGLVLLGSWKGRKLKIDET